jgi:hypothetical protein
MNHQVALNNRLVSTRDPVTETASRRLVTEATAKLLPVRRSAFPTQEVSRPCLQFRCQEMIYGKVPVACLIIMYFFVV